MRKNIVAFITSIAVATGCSSILSSAVDTDVISVDAATLTESIVIDGNVIPAGAVAITVSIDNNTGINSFNTSLLLGDAYSVIDTVSGKPVVEAGNVIDSSLYSIAENNNVVAFASASADTSYDDGEIFTIYADVIATGTDYSVTIDEVEDIPCAGINGYWDYFMYGDPDDDGYIDSIDASIVLQGIEDFQELYNTTSPMMLMMARDNQSIIFPNVQYVQTMDVNWDYYITETDAQHILDYYAALITGDFSGISSSNHCGEIDRIFINS